jgi:hypothetical protein
VQLKRNQQLGLGAIILLGLNMAIAHRFLLLEFSTHLDSIDGTFIELGKAFATHPTDLTWWPYWNLGIPFENTYLPLLHALVGLFSRLSGVSIPHAYHAVSGMFYCLEAVTLFLLGAFLSGRIAYSFVGGLLYSVTSPASILFKAIRDDAGGFRNARRLQVLAQYGEGPHMTTLAFLPLALLFLHLALQHRKRRYCVLAGIFMACVVLSNAFGVVVLFLATICLLATVHREGFLKNALIAGAIAVAAYAVISPSLTPSLLRTIQVASRTVGGDYTFTAQTAFGYLILAAGLAVLWALTGRWESQYLRFFLLFAFATTVIPALAYWFRIFIFRQPERYHVEAEMGLCMFGALVAPVMLDRWPKAVRQALFACVIIVAMLQTRQYIRYARGLIQPVDIATTIPYKMAGFLKANFTSERVFVPGSSSFLLNYFTDLPQLHGGHDPSNPNPLHPVAVFVIYSGMNTGARDAEISILWMKALGAHAVTVPGPTSVEFGPVFTNPHKFDGVLPEIWNYEGTKVFAIPSRSPSLAHVVPADAIVKDPPVNGLDTNEVARYVSALEDSAFPIARMEWHNMHSFVVHASAQPGQAVSIQENYADGWHAVVGGAAKEVSKDGLGFMVVNPGCQGDCAIEMYYDGGLELKLARIASVTALLGVLVWCLPGWKRRALTTANR